jgi:hypothetical protein
MKYATEMGSCAMSFMKTWFRHSKVDKGETHTHRQYGDCISLLLVFRNKKSRLKKMETQKQRWT